MMCISGVSSDRIKRDRAHAITAWRKFQVEGLDSDGVPNLCSTYVGRALSCWTEPGVQECRRTYYRSSRNTNETKKCEPGRLLTSDIGLHAFATRERLRTETSLAHVGVAGGTVKLWGVIERHRHGDGVVSGYRAQFGIITGLIIPANTTWWYENIIEKLARKYKVNVIDERPVIIDDSLALASPAENLTFSQLPHGCR